MHRILIVNVVLVGEKSGTGNTLKNILSVYPSSKIMQLCLNRYNDGMQTSIDNTIYVTNKFAPIPFFIQDIRAHLNKNTQFVANSTTNKKSIKSSLHDFVRGLLDALPVNYSDFIKKIDEFSPEVIYTCGVTIRIMKVVNFLAKRYNIKVILHLMDDWPSTLYTHKLSGIFRRMMLSQLQKCNDNSIVNFAISGALAEKYAKIYKKPYLPLMNPALRIASSVNVKKSEIVRFVYAGSVSLNRWKSLYVIADTLAQANRAGYKNEFVLYIPPNMFSFIEKEFNGTGTIIHGYVSHEKVETVYSNCDVLVFTESFEEHIQPFIRYSLSTKIPEYMAAGKPILAYLDSNLYSAKYLKKNNAACVVSDRDKLYESILNLICDISMRYQLAKAGIDCANREHSLESVRTKFISAINESCNDYDKENK